MTNGFQGLVDVPENADIFAGQEFTPTSSNSLAFSVQPKTTNMTGDKNAPNYQVLGSNISANAADMVPVKDESGNSGPLALNATFVRSNFPYKYIGIQYTANTNVGSGTFAMTIEKRAQLVKVS